MSETLLGQNRAIRSDDWMGHLPVTLSQTQHRPPFPVVNTVIHPDGQNMVFGITAPVLHWSTFFKPQVWGYFIDPDFGLAWHWSVRIIALALSSFFFFQIFFHSSSFTAAMASLVLVNSSFFAFWSYNSEPLTSLALTACLLIHKINGSKRPILWGLALVWVGASFCLSSLYPPFQIPLAYFTLLFGLYTFSQTNWPRMKIFLTLSLIALSFALVGLHFWQNIDSLNLFTKTAYPGERISTGGTLSLSHFFHLTLLALNGYSAYSPLNISELGSGIFIGIGLFFVSLFHSPPKRFVALRKWLTAITSALALYSFLGIPEIFAKATLLSFVPSARTLGLWSLLNVCWVVYFSTAYRKRLPSHLTLHFIPVILFFVFTLGAGSLGQQESQHMTFYKALIGSVMASAIVILFWKNTRIAWSAFLGLTLISTVWFNPVNRESFSKIQSTKAANELLSLSKQEDFQTLLILDKSVALANLPRLLGIASYGGLLYPPQVGFFERLDPSGDNNRKYNRFAYTTFFRDESLQFHNPSPDTLHVGLDRRTLEEHFSNATVIEDFAEFLKKP